MINPKLNIAAALASLAFLLYNFSFRMGCRGGQIPQVKYFWLAVIGALMVACIRGRSDDAQHVSSTSAGAVK